MLGKKIIRGFFCAFLYIILVWGTGPVLGKEEIYAVSAEGEAPDPAQLYATSAVLMDADTGRVLYGKNADEPMAMASTTKIMTCILVLENGSLEDEISVSAYAASMPKVKLYVKKGDRFLVKDLLYSLMLESHNDSAVVLAEYIGKQLLGGVLSQKDPAEYSTEESKQAVAAFAQLMNQKAEELGCEDTCFVTPNGLDEGDHHTTARELAKIMSYCIKTSPEKDVFLEITAAPSYSFYANDKSYTCTNHNAFLNMMDGMISGKTGFTNKAGYCYVGALEREERTFVVALLACGWPNNKSYKWSDTRKLMEYGTGNYFFESLALEQTEGEERKAEPVVVKNGQSPELGETAQVETVIDKSGSGIDRILMKEEETVDINVRQLNVLEAPVKEGTVVGYVTYSVQGIVYRVENIVLTETVDEITYVWCFEAVLERFLM